MKYFVHIYHTVRSKFAVEADTHEEAMKKADELLNNACHRLTFDMIGGCVNTERDVVNADGALLPMHLTTESAEEVTGYMVDEVDDTEYERTVSYEADGLPTDDRKPYMLNGVERDTILAALRTLQRNGTPTCEIEDIFTNGGEHTGLDDDAIDDLCERINC